MIRLTFLVLVFSAVALSQKDYFGGPQGRVKRQMVKLATKWTNGQVNYVIQETLFPDPMSKESLIAGMDYISNRTCIKFVESATAAQRMKIWMSREAGCESPVGAPGTRSYPNGEYNLMYGSCTKMVSISVHELLHSLGAVHEHQRAERNDFLWVNQSEINRRGLQKDFAPYSYSMAPGLVPFEHGSVMGYEVSRYTRFEDQTNLFGAWNDDYTYTLGNRRITFFDMWKVNDYYQCWCPGTEHCKNGGYSNPKDCTKCVCPMGWFGKECESRQPGTKQLPKATTNWQTATIDFKFQLNAENFRGYHSTYTYIDAPAGKTIEVKVTTMDNFVCQPGCNFQGIEIKTVIYKNDNRITSPILCCDDASKQPLRNKTFTSTQNPTIIDTYTIYNANPSSVTIQYRYI